MTHAPSPTTTDAPHAPPPGRDAPSLVSLLEQQHSIYQQLHRISAALGSLIEQKDAEAIEALLQRRQPLIDRLVAIDAELAPHRTGGREQVKSPASQDRERATELATEVEAMRRAALERDAIDRQALQRVHAGLADELSRTKQAGRAVAAYRAAPAEGQNRFTDRQG